MTARLFFAFHAIVGTAFYVTSEKPLWSTALVVAFIGFAGLALSRREATMTWEHPNPDDDYVESQAIAYDDAFIQHQRDALRQMDNEDDPTD